jgi:mRNA-degrading endonuclease HigB of HigAB toxin-antitoxin module
MTEENHAEVEDQLEAWGAEISERDDEQREQLKTMMEENRAEIQAQREDWCVEVPEA